MILSLKPKALALLSVLLLAILATWGWVLDPDQPGRWAFLLFFTPLLWGACEFLQGGRGRREDILNWHRSVIAALSLILSLKAGFKLAFVSGLVDAGWVPAARQLSGILVGFFLAVWGNYLPKLASPWRPDEEWFDWQRVHRFVGWLALLSGIAVVAVWLFLPPETAKPVFVAILVAFSILSVGRKFISAATHSRRPPPPKQTMA